MHLVGFTIEIHYDARPSERQITQLPHVVRTARIFVLLAIHFVFVDRFVVHVCLAWSIVFIAVKQQKAAGCIFWMWEMGCTASGV